MSKGNEHNSARPSTKDVSLADEEELHYESFSTLLVIGAETG